MLITHIHYALQFFKTTLGGRNYHCHFLDKNMNVTWLKSCELGFICLQSACHFLYTTLWLLSRGWCPAGSRCEDKGKVEEFWRFKPWWWVLTLRERSLDRAGLDQRGVPVAALSQQWTLSPGAWRSCVGVRVFRVYLISETKGVKR